MEIKRLKDNQIRCAITEQEIEELGFHIDDIIGNTEVTQKFMHAVLEKVEEQEDIDVTLLSPMVRAELLQDHSMAITFGGITEEEKQGIFGRVMDMLEQMAGKKMAANQELPIEPEQEKLREIFKPLKDVADNITEEELDIFDKPTPLALEFAQIDEAVKLSKYFFGKEYIPESALYKTEGRYYLIMDFMYFSKKELRPFALAAVEYNNRQYATEAAIARIMEHGTCIMKENALTQLMQL